MQLRRGNWWWATAGVLMLAVGGVWAESVAAEDEQKEPETPASKEQQYYELMEVFADTFEQIERNYVKEIDRRQLMEAAVRGMLEELDPYSNYINPEELSRFNTQVEQEFGGIGIQVTMDQNTRRLQVMTPLPGTPAYKAGIKAGDLIMEIEGKTTENLSLDDAVKRLKGKAGEPVTIGIQHLGSNKIEQITLMRAIIHVSTVLGDTYNGDDSWNFMLDNEKKIGYIRLTSFSRDSTQELADALEELKKQGMKALVLDLRFNPGGLLTAATEIADLFLEEGKIVSTKGRNTAEKTWTAKKANTFAGFPMVVMVNRYSASASEIVSAALQDHKRAVIVGERTWGKGSVQNVIELEKGNSALKLTTASYHRPSGKNIHRFPGAKETDEWGVMPDADFAVPLSNEELQKYLDYRRQRDILSKDPPKSEFVDRQLTKAIEYLAKQLDQATAAKPAAGANDDAKKPDDKPAGEGAGASKQSSLRMQSLPRELRLPAAVAL